MKNDKNELPAKGLHPPAVESFVPMYPARKIKWDDESTYSYIPEDAPIVLWAWEFLRRNRLFQQYVDQSVLGKNPDFKGPPIKPPPQWGLRIADAMSGTNRPSSQEIARTVLGERYRDESEVGPMDLQKAIHPQIKATRKLIYERGYLRFLLKE